MTHITETMNQIGRGSFLAKASEELMELVRLVNETDKAGSLTLTITVKPASSGAMTISGKSTLKKPPEAPMETLLFATPDGNLVADNPNQKKLDLKVVPLKKVQ